MRSARRSAPVPRPGKPFGQDVTIFHCSRSCAMAGRDKVDASAVAPAASPAPVRKLRRFMLEDLTPNRAHARHRRCGRLPDSTTANYRERGEPSRAYAVAKDLSLAGLAHSHQATPALRTISFQWTETGLVGHLPAILDPIAKIDEGQLATPGLFDEPQHHVDSQA